MKLLLVLGSDESYSRIALCVKPLGFDFIRYTQVLKAMDNIDEVDPIGIIISARDFPRHWKILVQFIRHERHKDSCPIIILKGGNFPLEETSKAFFLGVSGIVSESLENPAELNRLQSILSRYIPVEEKRRAPRLYVEDWHRIGFVLSNPADNALITGDVKTISNTGLSFTPTHTAMMKDIFLDDKISQCSLRAGDHILSPICRLVRTGRIVSFQFASFPEEEETALRSYLNELPLLEMKMQKAG